MYFLHIHLNNFLENCGDVNEKQSERFIETSNYWKKDIKGVGRMMPDYC